MNGQTSIMMQSGGESKTMLAPFGEVVMYKIDSEVPRGKLMPKWHDSE